MIRIYSQSIGMEFSIEKCAMQKMKKSKKEITEGIEQSNKENTMLPGEKNYKYLRILEVDTIQTEMK